MAPTRAIPELVIGRHRCHNWSLPRKRQASVDDGHLSRSIRRPLKNTARSASTQRRLRRHARGVPVDGALPSTSLAAIVKPGVSTDENRPFCPSNSGWTMERFPRRLNYRGYTKSSALRSTTSVCHGIPDASRCARLTSSISMSRTSLDGWHGDASRMYPVGQVKRAAERLLEVTYECLMRVRAVKPGARTGAIGAAIQSLCRS